MENMDISVFPLPFSMHLIFSVLALALFLYQYSRQRRLYQLLMAVAIPATLLLYVNSSVTWHYCVGMLELVLIVAAVVSSVVDSIRNRALKKAGNADDTNGENGANDSSNGEQ